MRDSRVEEVEHISDSDSDETEDSASKRPTLGIFPNHIQQGGFRHRFHMKNLSIKLQQIKRK
jgi:hypothetical protein